MDPNVLECKVMVSSTGHDGPMGASGDPLSRPSRAFRAGKKDDYVTHGSLESMSKPLT